MAKVISIARKEKPNAIIQLGDLYDLYAHAKFPRSHNVMTPRQEVDKARELAEKFWADLKKAVPRASCYQLTGNHDVRPYKRILERYPEIERMAPFKEFFDFDGVSTTHDHRSGVEIDGVLYIHGYLSGLGKHAQYFQKSVVCGHTHKAGVVFFKQKKKLIFECNAGMLADDSAIPLSYTPTKFNHWTTTCALIDRQGPKLIRL